MTLQVKIAKEYFYNSFLLLFLWLYPLLSLAGFTPYDVTSDPRPIRGCKPESQKILSTVNTTFFTAKMQSD